MSKLLGTRINILNCFVIVTRVTISKGQSFLTRSDFKFARHYATNRGINKRISTGKANNRRSHSNLPYFTFFFISINYYLSRTCIFIFIRECWQIQLIIRA
mmetsp:Transcript_94582/g.267035  ORF Transcript_94582/g.267035 Transcript_94582/m.267035 type:complete len:101 (-) Transcript_94582:79-381(-)